MASKNKNKQGEFDLFSQPEIEDNFSIRKIRQTTDEALIPVMNSSVDEESDTLVIDEIGVNIKKSKEKLGDKRFHAIVQGVIDNDPAFENYFPYEWILSAYHIGRNSSTMFAVVSPEMLHPKRLEGYDFVHVTKEGKLAGEYMLGSYGIAKMREILSAMIERKAPYDSSACLGLITAFIDERLQDDTLHELTLHKEVFLHCVETIIAGLIKGKKYANLLALKKVREKAIQNMGSDYKNLLLKKIRYWTDMVFDGMNILDQHAQGGWETFSNEFEKVYPDNEWDKKMIWGIISGQKNHDELFTNEAEAKDALIQKYAQDIPMMIAAYIEEKDILIPYIEQRMGIVLSSLEKNPFVRKLLNARIKIKKQNNRLFRELLANVPDVKRNNGYVIHLPTRASSHQDSFIQGPYEQWMDHVKDWATQKQKNLECIRRLKSALEEYGITGYILDEDREEISVWAHAKKRHSMSLNDLFPMEEDQQIQIIQNWLLEISNTDNDHHYIHSINDIPPLKRWEKNPSSLKKYLDGIILPDPSVDAIVSDEGFSPDIYSCDEGPLPLRKEEEDYDEETIQEKDLADYFFYAPEDELLPLDPEREQLASWITLSATTKTGKKALVSTLSSLPPNLNFYPQQETIAGEQISSFSPEIVKEISDIVDTMNIPGLMISHKQQEVIYKEHHISFKEIVEDGAFEINIRLWMGDFDGTFDKVVEVSQREHKLTIDQLLEDGDIKGDSPFW